MQGSGSNPPEWRPWIWEDTFRAFCISSVVQIVAIVQIWQMKLSVRHYDLHKHALSYKSHGKHTTFQNQSRVFIRKCPATIAWNN